MADPLDEPVEIARIGLVLGVERGQFGCRWRRARGLRVEQRRAPGHRRRPRRVEGCRKFEGVGLRHGPESIAVYAEASRPAAATTPSSRSAHGRRASRCGRDFGSRPSHIHLYSGRASSSRFSSISGAIPPTIPRPFWDAAGLPQRWPVASGGPAKGIPLGARLTITTLRDDCRGQQRTSRRVYALRVEALVQAR